MMVWISASMSVSRYVAGHLAIATVRGNPRRAFPLEAS
jgi:hypothetical protein